MLLHPFFKLSLPLLAVVERKYIREQAAGDLFDFVFGDIGFIDEFLFDLTAQCAGIEKVPPFYLNNM